MMGWYSNVGDGGGGTVNTIMSLVAENKMNNEVLDIYELAFPWFQL